MSYHKGPNTELEHGTVGGQPSQSFEEANPFPEQGKHRMYNPSVGSLYNIYFMYMIVHLCVGVGWNLAALGLFPLHEYPVYPHDGCRTLEWLCLVL
jgi:hypothetical protein